MPDSQLTGAERPVQSKFRKLHEFSAILLIWAIIAAAAWLQTSDRRPLLGHRSVSLRFEPLSLTARAAGPFRIAGAWRVASDDHRVGGVSGLARQGQGLLAITDAGVAIRFRPPGGGLLAAQAFELPARPGEQGSKRASDSEALTRDPSGLGWWVAYENGHRLHLLDPSLSRLRAVLPLAGRPWRPNAGIEALASDGEALLLIPENAAMLVRLEGGRLNELPLVGVGPVSEALTLPNGALLLLERRVTPHGFVNSLVEVRRAGNAYRATARWRIPLGPLDNAEAMALDRRPDGTLRLWLMTDNNFQPPLRTLLVALDMPYPSSTEGGGNPNG